MTFAPGDIVQMYAPTVGYPKYHLCLGKNDAGTCCFVFLNSEDRGYAADIAFDCARFPMIPKSATNRSVVSISVIIPINDHQLTLYKAKKLGELPKDVAAEVRTFASTVKALSRPDKAFLIQCLEGLI
jgi:hypothetical protein